MQHNIHVVYKDMTPEVTMQSGITCQMSPRRVYPSKFGGQGVANTERVLPILEFKWRLEMSF